MSRDDILEFIAAHEILQVLGKSNLDLDSKLHALAIAFESLVLRSDARVASAIAAAPLPRDSAES